MADDVTPGRGERQRRGEVDGIDVASLLHLCILCWMNLARSLDVRRLSQSHASDRGPPGSNAAIMSLFLGRNEDVVPEGPRVRGLLRGHET